MRSNRLALLAILAGSALLGTAAGGVSAIAGVLPKPAPAPAPLPLEYHHYDEHRGL